MSQRLKTLGAALAVIGLIFVAGGVFAYAKVKAGADSLQAFSAAQDVSLSYNEDGQLIDRGTVEGAEAILALLEDEWNYPVNMSELDPNDPLVNTGTEYMFQMATVAYHVLHGIQTIVLTEDKEYNGETFPAGEYSFAIEGRYWTDFDRSHPLEGPAREKAWTGTVHGLIAELGVGSVTASTLQMGYGISGLIGGIGLTSIFAGLGLIWVSMGAPAATAAVAANPAAKPAPKAKPKAASKAKG